MAKKPAALEVLPIARARDEFSLVVKRFREQGMLADPVIFGSHRKPEAVTIPFDLYVALQDAIEDIQIAEIVRSREESPLISWQEGLDRLGITQADVDAVDLGKVLYDVD